MTFKPCSAGHSIRKHTTKILYSTLISMAVIAATNPTMGYAQEKAQDKSKKVEQKKTDKKKADQDQILEEVIVTGIRGSIINSIAKKRNSSSIVEALSAEDIGKLPDTSIAESLARLPGLAAQRVDGRASVISIRGLAPDFTTTTLNGREMVSANNNRAVEFDQFPSELINGVTVYKTTEAKLTSQAVGGTVDLQTVRPLAYGKRAIVMNVRGEYNDLGALNSGTTAMGYRGTFSYIDQFADDTIGVAIGYARMLSPTQEKRWNAWGFPTIGNNTFTDAGGNAVDQGTFIIGGAKPFVKSNELTRDGLMGVLEYEPNENFHSTIDLYYSKFSDKQTLRGIELPLKWSGAQLQDGFTVKNGLVTAGTFNGVEGVVRNDFVDRKAETYAVGWNATYQIDENWSVEADLSYSKVDRIERNVETYSGTGRGSGVGAVDNIGFTLDKNAGAVFSPTLDYSDPSLIQLGGPLSWGGGLIGAGVFNNSNGQDGFINRPKTNDDIKTIRLSAERLIDDSFLSSIEVGARYANRRKSLKDGGVFLTLKGFAADPANLPGGDPTLATFGTLPVPSQFLLSPTSLAFIGMGNVLSYDARALLDSGAYIETDESLSAIGRSVNSWTVTEKVTNLYIQGNIDTEVGDIPLTGNIGLQAVYTNQSSTGLGAKAKTLQDANGKDFNVVVKSPVTGGDKYWEFLPSLNLSLEVADNQKLRLGIARVLARPRMDQMNASFKFDFNSTRRNSTDINNSPWSGSGGNPKLRPFMTWQYDLSYELYFGKGGYFALAGFYKKITSFPFDQSTPFDFSSILGISGEQNVAFTKGLVTQPQNLSGGKIYGLEISGSVPFSMIAEELDGFGATFSASFTDSSIKETPTSKPRPMEGLSKTVINSTLYYEKNGFAARVSLRHRSEFLGEVSGLSLIREKKFVKAENIVDAQVSYDLSEIGIEGVTILFQGKNLTNQTFSTFQGSDKNQIRDFQNFGRTYFFGLNYKM